MTMLTKILCTNHIESWADSLYCAM